MPFNSPLQRGYARRDETDDRILELLRQPRPQFAGAIQPVESWMLQVAAGDESIVLRQGVSQLNVRVTRNQVHLDGVVGGSRPGTTVAVQSTSTTYPNQVEAAIAFQRLAAKYVGQGYEATPDGPLGRRVLDNQANARALAALEQEMTRRDNDRRVRAETNAADAARMMRMALAIQAGQTEDLEDEEVPARPPPVAAAPASTPSQSKSLLQRLSGKRKLRRHE